MTAVMTPPQTVPAKVDGAPALPQVNLLPPEIRAGRQLGRLKGWLGVGLLVTVLAAGLLFVSATLAVTQAQDELTEAQAETQRLQEEQKQYAEVPLVLRQLEEARTARIFGMSTEVMWKPYFGALAASAPADVSFESFIVSAATPMSPPGGPSHPLEGPSVGVISFVTHSATLPDIAQWIDNLEAIPGFANAWFTSAEITSEDDTVYYQTNGTVQLTEAAYAKRFEVTDTADDVEVTEEESSDEE